MKSDEIHVLVVEDEILIGLMLAKKLRSTGYRVGEVATTGEEAVSRAGSDRPDVVLMDVTLAGEMNGLEAARRIRDDYGTAVIIFSGYDNSQFHEQIRQIEPVAVLAKMGPIADVMAAIEKAAGRHELTRRK